MLLPKSSKKMVKKMVKLYTYYYQCRDCKRKKDAAYARKLRAEFRAWRKWKREAK
jgi:hypothetical protein